MEELFQFSKKKEERFLEIILFAHLATIHCDSHLCEQEAALTQRVIDDLVDEGYVREDVELKAKKIEDYILARMMDKTKDFIMIFETSLKQVLPPAETALYNKLAHVIMKGACIDDDYTEQERRLFQRFRRIILSINDEEQKKMDYGSSLKNPDEKKNTRNTAGNSDDEELSEGELLTGEEEKTPDKDVPARQLPEYEFSIIDDEIPGEPGENHLQKYEDGIPDDVTLYEKDQIHMMEMVRRIWDVQRKKSAGLFNVEHISSFSSFALGGCMYGLPASGSTEFFFVGDLHGCYNNLKAVLWQSDFINKVNSGKDVYLVFLGDFFDRGTRTLDGIMPLVLQLVLEYPERVILLRGNHEHFVLNKQGIVESAVRPCETITFWKAHLSNDFFKAYLSFFNQMPLMAFFSNGIVAIHGGIPPGRVLDQIHVLGDFNNLNDIDRKRLAYSLLWTDPGAAEDMPINLKAIFHAPFGKKQFRAFMEKIGARLLVRGHEAIKNGCEFTYPGSLITIFSSGGKDNPHSFAYNNITPRFLRIRNNNRIDAVKIHWHSFSDESPGEQ